MTQTPQSQQPRSFEDETLSPGFPQIPLAIIASIVGAIAGALLTKALGYVLPVYIPVIPGFLIGYCVVRVCSGGNLTIRIIAAVFGFIGAVFTESIWYVGHPGIWHYMTHFYENATTLDWVFRVGNVLVAYWYSGTPTVTAYTPAAPPVPCPHCGAANLSRAKYCSECGNKM